METHSSSPTLEPTLLPDEILYGRLHLIRGQRVMLDQDLADLYQVPTKVLNQAVRRNLDRFPEDFMFQLTESEISNLMSQNPPLMQEIPETDENSGILRSQIVTSSWGGRRHLPFAFTEQGVAMLSSVLKSPRAVQVNIQIMRLFVKMRRLIISYEDLASRMETVEAGQAEQGDTLQQILQLLGQWMGSTPPRREPVGFKTGIHPPPDEAA